jgi:uroporphyrinogen III methyltransferase/synthase
VLVVGEVVDLRQEIGWFEQRPLFGRRVVVTRASRQAGGLVHALAAQGADAVAFPCLDVAPPLDRDALDRAVAALPDAYDGVVLSSPNGVDAFFDALVRVGLDARALAGRTVAVVGTGTADACRRRGITPDLVPDKARAEGLAEAFQAEGWLGRRWLHVRADEGREVLGEAIHSAGGQYTLAIGYRTVRPAIPHMLVQSLRSPEDGGEGFDAVCFASGKTARHFVETLTEVEGEDGARWMVSAAKIVTIGPVTTAAVEALGFEVAQTAAEPTQDALVAAVIAAVR